MLMKRRAFHISHAAAFRWVLPEWLVWRLQLQKPRVVGMTLDTLVMDNDEAWRRQGCDPTYKKVKDSNPYSCSGKARSWMPFSDEASGSNDGSKWNSEGSKDCWQ